MTITITPDRRSDAAPLDRTTRLETGSAVLFRSVVKRFGEVRALDGVDLDIAAGETVALLGPNGAGKSTAIGLMLALLRPAGGQVRVLGGSASDARDAGRTGAMLQSGSLPAGARVGELVDFVRGLYPRPLPLGEVLERAGLTPLRNRFVERLSGGETQRTRFALAIAGNPELVFLDEPTVAMDVEARRAFWGQMREFAAEGRTVLFATHYLDEADAVADRIVVLHRGRVVADGTSTEIKARAGSRVIRFTLPGAMPAPLLALPGVSDVSIHGADVTVHSTDTDATVRALYEGRFELRDLAVTGAGLEDAFVALTDDRAA